ncbi:Tn3 family transposase [Streptomyces sp. NPDC058375]|uniref:Tn3 family transposase n=1 Tax=Streptomyces sp. NPDC058375 TaxID=3346467 RepID=UPI0036583B82
MSKRSNAEPGRDYPVHRKEPTEEALHAYDLLEKDHALLQKKRGAAMKLGFALQLGHFRCLGWLPAPREIADIPRYAVQHVGTQLGIGDPVSVLADYGRQDGLTRRHAKEIREAYGWRAYHSEESEALRQYLVSRAETTEEDRRTLTRLAVLWLRHKGIELPGQTTLSNLAHHVRTKCDEQMYSMLLSPFTNKECPPELKALIDVSSNEQVSPLAQLSRSPGKPEWGNLEQALGRCREIGRLVHLLGLPVTESRNISPRRLAFLARFAKERELGGEKRYAAVVAALIRLRETSVDDAVEIMMNLISHEFIGKARRATKKYKEEVYDDLVKALFQLGGEVTRALSTEHETVDTTTGEITPPSSEQTTLAKFLREMCDRTAIDEGLQVMERLAVPQGADSQRLQRTKMIENFPTLSENLHHITALDYQPSTEARHIVEALRSLPDLLRSPTVTPADLDNRLMTGAWRELIMRANQLNPGEVNIKAYAFCVVVTLYYRLNNGEIHIRGASKWGGGRDGNFNDIEWAEKRPAVAESMGLPLNPLPHLRSLAEHLHASISATASRIPQDNHITFGSDGRLRISKKAQLTHPQLPMVSAELKSWMDRIDLPKLLLAVLSWTGAAEALTTLSGGKTRTPDLEVSFAAALVAVGCNVGIDAVASGSPALSRTRILYVIEHFLRPECLSAVTERLLGYQTEIDIAKVWRGERVASVIGQRFATPPTAWPSRPAEDGTPVVTQVSLISDQFMGVADRVVAGPTETCLHVLDVLNDRRSRRDGPSRNSPDQNGLQRIVAEASPHQEVFFGLLALSGYAYVPTIADINEVVLSRMSTAVDEHYGPLEEATRKRIDADLIERNWDDMLRLAGAVHSGRLRSEDAIRRLVRHNRLSSLGRAFAHYGMIYKTMHILDLLNSPEYRRQIEAQSQGDAKRQKLASKVDRGQTEEFRHYQSGAEEQLGALQVIVNMIALYNTVRIDQFVKERDHSGQPVARGAAAGLNPYEYAHCNMEGRYAFEKSGLPSGYPRAVDVLKGAPPQDDGTDLLW